MINFLWYTAEGNAAMAAATAVAIVPAAGSFIAKGTKQAIKAGKKAAQKAGEKAVRNATEKAAKKAAKKKLAKEAGKEAAEKGAEKAAKEAAEKATEKTAKEVTEKSAERTAKEAVEKGAKGGSKDEILSTSKRQTPDQNALHRLAKEAEKNAKKGNPISYEEAKILDEWAKEYNVPQHHPAEVGSGQHFPGGNHMDHTHIYNIHVPYEYR